MPRGGGGARGVALPRITRPRLPAPPRGPCRPQTEPEIKQLGRYAQVRRAPSAAAEAAACVVAAASDSPTPRPPPPCPPCSPPPPGRLHIQLGILGSGTYGLVIRARDTSDPDAQDVAIKLLPRGGFVSAAAARTHARTAALPALCHPTCPASPAHTHCPAPAPAPAPRTQVKEYRRYVMREVMHHGGLKHPFIIDLKEVFLTPEYLAIVMEFAQGGNVSSAAGGGGGSSRGVCVGCCGGCCWGAGEARWGVLGRCVGVCWGAGAGGGREGVVSLLGGFGGEGAAGVVGCVVCCAHARGLPHLHAPACACWCPHPSSHLRPPLTSPPCPPPPPGSCIASCGSAACTTGSRRTRPAGSSSR